MNQPPTTYLRHSTAARPSIGLALWGLASLASIGASAFHGYRRNRSTGWAVVWGLAGGIAPIITPAIAIAQGFGQRKTKRRRRKRRR